MCSPLEGFFSGWSEENFWIFIVDVSILVLIFLREYIWDFLVWLYRGRLASLDNLIVGQLRQAAPGVYRNVNEISVATGIKQNRVRRSLDRLSRKHDVETDGHGGWYAIRRYVTR
jgi:hypothetical protein